MARNIILFLALAAIATVGYFGLTQFLGDVGAEPPAGDDPLANMTSARKPQDADLFNVLNGPPVRPGEAIQFVRHDPRTNAPRERFRCEEWRPLGDDKQRIAVQKPELAAQLGNDVVVTVRAKEGELAVERMDQVQSTPKRGVLRGDVQILIDRATTLTEVDVDAPAPDRVTIRLDELRFDLEIGTLSTEGPIRVDSREFEVAGRGLYLEWNQADNVVKELVIREGERLVLHTMNGLPGGPTPAKAAAAEKEAPAAGQTPLQGPKPRAATAYEIRIDAQVQADQFQGEQRVAGLTADAIRLLVDVGGNAERLLERPAEAQTTSAPSDVAVESAASAPAVADAEAAAPGRLELKWVGPLHVKPVGAPGRAPGNRRRFAAHGAPVRLEQGPSTILCERVEFYDDTQQAWLYGGKLGPVRFERAEAAAGHADSVYIDQAAGLVKLIGDVRLQTRGNAKRRDRLTITSNLWGELQLREDEAAGAADEAVAAAPEEGGLDFGGIEAARFVGAVDLRLGQDRLQSGQLDVRFADERAAAAEGGANQLEAVVASGGVAYRSADQALECDRLQLDLVAAPNGEIYPRTTHASGAVKIRRGRATAFGRTVQLELEAAQNSVDAATAGEANAAKQPVELQVRRFEIRDQARLRDPEARIAARGSRIFGVFDANQSLSTAEVLSDGPEPAEVRADNYRVRGRRIELDPGAQTLQVRGPSWLAFDADRRVGSAARRPIGVEVSANELLKVDVRNDRIDFVGDVIAHSGDEVLRSEQLQLLLRSVAPPPVAAQKTLGTFSPWTGVSRFVAAVRGQGPAEEGGDEPAAESPARGAAALAAQFEPLRAVLGMGGADSRAPQLTLSLGIDAEAQRKEPVRLVAQDALFESEVHDEAGKRETIAEVQSPRLDFEIDARRLVSQGTTALCFTSLALKRAAAPDAAPAGDPLAGQSPLLSRGPSQTGLICQRSMTYIIGATADGVRRDAVLFEGDVRFVHRVGREFQNLEHWLPELTATDRNQLGSRITALLCERLECEFVAEAGGSTSELPSGNLKLAWLIASASGGKGVYLRDEERPVVRTIECDRLEFNREQALVTVNGTPTQQARVQIENVQTNQFSTPVVGQTISIDLRSGQVRTDRVQGEFRR